VLSVKKAFRTIVKLAKIDTTIDDVTPRTLRHTAATWLMESGTDLWSAAGHLGTIVEVLERVHGHHHPDHLAEAVEGITAKRPRKQNLGWAHSWAISWAAKTEFAEMPCFNGRSGRIRTCDPCVPNVNSGRKDQQKQ
jgi:hypothetical protein